MNPYLQVILWAVGIVVLFIVMMAWNNHKWKKTQKNRIKRIFGKIPEREYSPDDLERISHYFRRKENGEFYIDDITWNDLDMDRIFIQINQRKVGALPFPNIKQIKKFRNRFRVIGTWTSAN